MTPAGLLDALRRRGVRLATEGDRLWYEVPPGALTPELWETMRRHKPALLELVRGTEVEAGSDWRPRLGESWPAAWNDGRCVRCDGRRWRWSQAESRWLCTTCGVDDSDRPLARPVAAPAPSDASPPADSDGWPLECLASERLYGVRAARLYPLLGKRVTTPAGSGVLLQVFSSRAAVLVDGAALHFKPEEVRP